MTIKGWSLRTICITMNSKNFDLLTYNQLLEMAKNEEHNDGATFRKNIYTKKNYVRENKENEVQTLLGL